MYVAYLGLATRSQLHLSIFYTSVLGYQLGSSRLWIQSIVATVVGDRLAY
jgi:hypothetical protein